MFSLSSPEDRPPSPLKKVQGLGPRPSGVGVLHETAQDSTSHRASVQCCLLEALPEVQLWRAWAISPLLSLPGFTEWAAMSSPPTNRVEILVV